MKSIPRSAGEKGRGALLREKIVAAASKSMVVIADESKWVETLGAFPLPVEVTRFGFRVTLNAFARRCAQPSAAATTSSCAPAAKPTSR